MNQNLNKHIYYYLVLSVLIGGCVFMKNDMQNNLSGKLYFVSPQEAIPRISDMLRQEDFNTLAKYYDLSTSDIPLPDLESGDFFIRKEQPEIAHPAGFWRYKHPFSPGFNYCGIQSGNKENVYIITVMLSIDQGEDSPNQEGYSSFYMIKSIRGWQILPDQVVENGKPELPENY